MSSLLPQFHHHIRPDGSKVLRLGYTEEARRVLKERRENPPPKTSSLLPSLVRQKASEVVTRLGGDCTNELQVLGQHELQFGVFSGKSFLWVLSNALGYAGYIVDEVVNVDKERETEAALSKNKFLFKSYTEKFKQGIEAVKMKKREREKTASSKTVVAVSQLLNKNVSPSVMARKALVSGRSLRPAVQPNITSTRSSTVTTTSTTTKNTASTTTVSTTKSPTATATNTTTSALSAADTTSVTVQDELSDAELLAVSQPMSLSYTEGRPLLIILSASIKHNKP